MSKSISRTRGVLLLGLGALLFAGTTAEMLPMEAFWGGLALSALGLVQFMKSNRVALKRAEVRTQRMLHPDIRRDAGRAYAEQQARRAEDLGVAALGGNERDAAAALAASTPVEAHHELELEDLDSDASADDFAVSTDVSFPVEVQNRNTIADELHKLKKLHADGILSDEEFTIAKTKLLG